MSVYGLKPILEPIAGDYRVSCRGLVDILEARATMLAIETSTIGLDGEKTNVVRGQRREVMLLLEELKQILHPRES